jgi:hypothetical protein
MPGPFSFPSKAALVAGAAALAVAAAVAAADAKKLLMIKSPTGTPLGLSVRTPQHIATLIQALEPYVPSLHRDAARDRYRIGLFLQPLDGRAPGRLIPITAGQPAADDRMKKLFGSDGTTVWFSVGGLGGVNLQTGQLVRADDLRRANPALGEPWDDPRRVSFDGRLRMSTGDQRTMFEVDPATLRATAMPAERSAGKTPFAPAVVDFLATGVRPTPTTWLGLHSAKETERDYRPKARIARLNRAEEAKELRRLHRGELGPELDRGYRELLSLARASDDEFLNAAFVRRAAHAEPLRLAGPDGFLMIHTSQPGLAGTLVVARVDAAGKIAWRADTRIDRFKLAQILPDPRHIAFIGTRPPVPGQVPEPILVIIDTESGALATTSLWQ